MTAAAPWTVLPHGPLVARGPGLWTVEGTLPNMPLNRVCTIARRADGDLVIHSAIAVDAPTLAAIEALGRPAWLVVPNGFHRLDAPAWLARFPGLRVIAPPGSRAKVEEKVPVHLDMAEAAAHFGPDQGVGLAVLDGTGGAEGVLTVAQEGRAALVFNDALFNHPHVDGIKGLLMRLIGSTGGPRVTNLARFALVKDKPALARAFRALAETEGLDTVIPGHGAALTDDPAAVLRHVATTL